jgi:ABC-2 type transport system permease protein
MNAALTIARKEYQLALRSLVTYIVFVIFLLFAGFFFANTALKLRLAELRGVFGIMHTLFLFYIPALTMGSIARERSSGTLELVSTLPLRLGSIVWGKFLGALLLLATVLAFTLVFLGLVSIYGTGLDYGAVATGYLGMLLLGAAYIGIGIFASSLSENQVLAFIIALAISGFFYLLRYLGDFASIRLLASLQYLGFDYHLQNFLKGVIDTRDLLFFAVVAYVSLLLAELRLQAQNLRQER